MIKGILDKLCEINAIMAEKLEQTCELVEQNELLCEKLDAILDPEGECPPCPVLRHTWAFSGFDEDGGVFSDADYVHTSTVNGTATAPNTLSPSWTNKSDAYANTIAAVNALPGHSMTVVSDVPLTDNGKVAFRIVVPAGETLTIVNTHTDDVLTFSTAEDGSCVGTFQDSNGDEITSYSPVEQ